MTKSEVLTKPLLDAAPQCVGYQLASPPCGGGKSLLTSKLAYTRRILLTFATVAAVLSLTSCSNNDDPAEPNLGSAPVVVSVALDTTMTHFTTYDTESRAGSQPVLRLQVQAIADKDHRVLARETRLIRPGQPLGGEVRFTLPSGKHHLLAWADYVADSATPTDLYYRTADLTDISFMGSTYVGDNDHRNAYAATAPVEFKVYEGDTTTVIHSDLSLKSIMGKLRFVATDYNEWLSKAQPLRVLVSYTGFLPNRYSVLRGVPFDSTTGISFLTSMRDGSTESGTVTLAEDLVMVNGDESSVQVAMGLYDDDGQLVTRTQTLTVPLRRGGITTVTGHFLTKTSSAGGIGIDPSFGGDINVYY